MVLLILIEKEKLICVDKIFGAVVADLHLNRLQAVRAEKALPSHVPGYGGIAHVPVPRLLLAHDGIDAFVAGLIHAVQPVDLRRAFDDHAVGVRQRLADFPHPFLRDMGGAHDHVEGFLSGIQRAESGGADLGLAAAAFGPYDGDLVLTELSPDGLRDGELRVVERIPGGGTDVIVHRQHFIRKRLRRRIEQGLKLIADAIRHGNAEGVQILCDGADLLKAIR